MESKRIRAMNTRKEHIQEYISWKLELVLLLKKIDEEYHSLVVIFFGIVIIFEYFLAGSPLSPF